MIAPELISRVRDATDIVAVIQKSVPLKKAGANWKGLCPFHGEKTPSFNVHPAKQIFHCFGCGEGGDVFAFLVKKDKLSFVEAVKQLAGEAGIEIEEQERDPQAEAAAKEKEDLTRLLELAADWFRRNFKDGADAEAARAYAAKRGLSDETLERFQIGYAPGDGGALERAATKKGFSREQLLKAGLLGQGEDGRSYCRFRRRLMFPIQDARGRVVGFGGRILVDGEPKYLNSPETALFSKSRLLYAMPQAKEAMQKKKRALLTEGYMDAIACQQAGIHEAIAVLGTALTEEHARQLKRYVDQVLLVFDADVAGLRAALRGGEMLLKAGLEPKVLRLGEFKDPDEFIKARGREAFEAELENAGDAVAFFADALLSLAKGQKEGELSLREKAAVMQQIFPLLARYATAMEAEVQLQKASQRLGLPAEAVKEDFEAYKAKPAGARAMALTAGSAEEEAGVPEDEERAGSAEPQRRNPVLENVERELIALLLNARELMPEAMAQIEIPDFTRGELAEAAHLLWKFHDKQLMEFPAEETAQFSKGEALLQQLAWADQEKYKFGEEQLSELVARRQMEIWKEKSAELQRALDAGPDTEKQLALLTEKGKLSRLMNDFAKAHKQS